LAFRHRRGFIKESEEYAKEFRQELGLTDCSPLTALELADHLSIPVWELTKHPNIQADVVEHFTNGGQNDFSAVTLNNGTYKEIIHNDSHHPYRQNSNIAHELAHIILGHPPKPPMLKDGCRNFDKRMEREAHDLGFTLLVPKPAALVAVEDFLSLDEACQYFHVSEQLLEFRIRKSDAKRWALNRAQKRSGW
jgi:Zn-dependent peptidase ImmA (M78 family)|tara:strand:- start:7135 stop:7713 length:579 start_codon:yes stop_codon:yes gene_type:complete